MESIIDEAKLKYKGKANIIIINLDYEYNFPLAMEYEVRVVPTFLIFDGENNLLDKIEGVMTRDEIDRKLKEAGAL